MNRINISNSNRCLTSFALQTSFDMTVKFFERTSGVLRQRRKTPLVPPSNDQQSFRTERQRSEESVPIKPSLTLSSSLRLGIVQNEFVLCSRSQRRFRTDRQRSEESVSIKPSLTLSYSLRLGIVQNEFVLCSRSLRRFRTERSEVRNLYQFREIANKMGKTLFIPYFLKKTTLVAKGLTHNQQPYYLITLIFNEVMRSVFFARILLLRLFSIFNEVKIRLLKMHIFPERAQSIGFQAFSLRLLNSYEGITKFEKPQYLP